MRGARVPDAVQRSRAAPQSRDPNSHIDPGLALRHAADVARCAAGQSRIRKILPQRHQLPGPPDHFEAQKPEFYWVFCDGTAFADLQS